MAAVSSMKVSRRERAVTNSASLPEVGKYTPMCIEGEKPGIFRRIGRKEDEVVGSTTIYGSSLDLHITSVPPLALVVSRARSGLLVSSLFKITENSPVNGLVRRAISH